MPSFDVVSEIDPHELTNAVDQANREVSQRFDFKGTGAKYELNEYTVTLEAQVDFQLKQMLDILTLKVSKRGIDVACLDAKEPDGHAELGAPGGRPASWHRPGNGQEAAADAQGREAQGPGADPGRAAAGDRQAARRAAVGHRPAEAGRTRRALAIQELPRLIGAGSGVSGILKPPKPPTRHQTWALLRVLPKCE